MDDRRDVPERRQRLLVDRPFQYGVVRLLGTMWLVNMVVLGGLLYYLYVGPVFRVDHLAGQPNVVTINASPPQFGMLLTLGAVLGLALVGVVGLHMSHQIAGPLAQVKSRLRDVAAGELDAEIRFRHGDYLTDLPECFNEMTHALRERVRDEVERLEAIEATLDASSPARAQLHELIEDKRALLVAASGAAAQQTSESSPEPDPLPTH